MNEPEMLYNSEYFYVVKFDTEGIEVGDKNMERCVFFTKKTADVFFDKFRDAARVNKTGEALDDFLSAFKPLMQYSNAYQ